jgi:hypothetical protein
VRVEEWCDKTTENVNSAKKEGTRSLIILVYWVICRERNNRIFDSKEKQSSHIATEIRDEAKLWPGAGAKDLSQIVSPTISE